MMRGRSHSRASGYAPLWTPAGRGTDVQLWLQADLEAAVSGGRVTDWADQSTYSRDYTQATSGLQFDLVTADAAYGNKPVLQSRGGQYMAPAGAWTLPQPFTTYVVADSAAATYETVFDNTLTPQCIFRGSPFGWELYGGAAAINAGTCTAPSIVCGVFNGANSALYLTPATAAVSGSTGTTGVSSPRLGVAPGAIYPLGTGARVFAWIIVSGADSLSQRTDMMRYLSGCTGIALP